MGAEMCIRDRCTPLNVRQIVAGQQQAIKELFFGPLMLLVGVEVLLMIVQVAVYSADKEVWSIIVTLVFGGLMIAAFVLDVFAVSRVGMWFGVTSAKPTVALTKTVLLVLVLPLFFAPCCNFMAGGLMLAKSIIFMTWAQSKLDNDFRKAATARYDARPADWLKPASPEPLRMPV